MSGAERTLMFAEAGEAASAVAAQLSANRDAVAAVARHLVADPPITILTCARGSSDHAATFAKYLFETRLGIATASLAPSVASVYRARARARSMLCVAISQSGRSPDLLASFAAARDGGAFGLALVNDPESPLAGIADHVLPLHASPERSVAATKSFIGSLAALAALVAAWGADAELEAALAGTPERLAGAWQADWSPLSEGLVSVRGLYVVGRGVGLGIAQEAALKLKEVCGIHAEAFSAAELRHGPLALVGPDFPLLVFRQADETQETIDELVGAVAALGADVFIAGGEAKGAVALPTIAHHPALEPMLQIQSFYRAAIALALARGLDPDRPPHLAKVTETV